MMYTAHWFNNLDMAIQGSHLKMAAVDISPVQSVMHYVRVPHLNNQPGKRGSEATTAASPWGEAENHGSTPVIIQCRCQACANGSSAQ